MGLPKPYYEEPGIVIYHADCREVLPYLPPVDLVLTDPPYGLDWNPTGFRQNVKTDWQSAGRWDVRPDTAIIQQIKTIGREWIVWGGNYLAKDLGDCKSPFVWDKQTGANTFADGEMAFTSLKTGTLRIYRHQWCGVFKDSERGIRSHHPTQKPIALMKWCIQQTKEIATILDPFMGSGTTLRAAKDLGLSAIGIEIEEKYCAIAVERLRQEVLPLTPMTSEATNADGD